MLVDCWLVFANIYILFIYWFVVQFTRFLNNCIKRYIYIILIDFDCYMYVLNLINVCIQNCTACKLINLWSVNYNIEWIVLQLEAIRAKQVHKAPPTFPHQQHHFQVLVTWLSIIYGFFFIVKDLRKILQVDIPNWHPLINYLKTHINECKSKCNFLLPYWIFIIILQRVI